MKEFLNKVINLKITKIIKNLFYRIILPIEYISTIIFLLLGSIWVLGNYVYCKLTGKRTYTQREMEEHTREAVTMLGEMKNPLARILQSQTSVSGETVIENPLWRKIDQNFRWKYKIRMYKVDLEYLRKCVLKEWELVKDVWDYDKLTY